ncbi:hypothetical protein [Sodaliphilus pleomorphus]|uniref:Uncharacterized protein n=1 Tax=Sodaliphilus pleomorphus TaxID=2606626 RepID=A0A6L5XGM2_9BACT|nr:hypothetical protein [Sodaliphilus pleomorphus]MSS18677.1 hypothetical protein [Sodaliphilus pleomorphus]
MEKTEIIKIIEQVNDYRFKRMRRDNLKWHLDLDTSRGYKSLAESRVKLLAEAQKDLDAIEPEMSKIIMDIKQRFAMHPRDQQLRLISLYIDLIEMDPMKMEKHRQKINSLRPKVLGTMDEMDQIRQQNSLFD